MRAKPEPVVLYDVGERVKHSEYLETLRGITAYLEEHPSYRLLVPRYPDDAFALAGSDEVVGVFILERPQEEVDGLLALGKHVVARSSEGAMSRYPCVRYDDREIGRIGAGHLLECGFTRFAFCGTDHPAGVEREEAFVQAIADAGFACVVNNRPSFHEAKERMDQWVQSLPCPCGVMAFNDMIAYYMVEACVEVGIEVPHQLAVLGVDNEELRCTLSSKIDISSIERDVMRFGYEMAALMDRLIQGDAPPRHPIRVKPVGVVARTSTDVIAFTDPVVAKALRFIRSHAESGIGVDDVARHVGVTRRTLTRHFVACLERAPGDEIRRVRLERARELLLKTRTAVNEIAYDIGFACPSYFTKAFKQAYGCTPSSFREQRR